VFDAGGAIVYVFGNFVIAVKELYAFDDELVRTGGVGEGYLVGAGVFDGNGSFDLFKNKR